MKSYYKNVCHKKFGYYGKTYYLCKITNNRKEENMALSIRPIPTLYGKEAEEFERQARQVEANPGKQNYTKEAKIVRDYLKSINL